MSIAAPGITICLSILIESNYFMNQHMIKHWEIKYLHNKFDDSIVSFRYYSGNFDIIKNVQTSSCRFVYAGESFSNTTERERLFFLQCDQRVCGERWARSRMHDETEGIMPLCSLSWVVGSLLGALCTCSPQMVHNEIHMRNHSGFHLQVTG